MIANPRLYGCVIHNYCVMDCDTTIPNHTIVYVQSDDGLWQATLERWNGDDPCDYTVIHTTARHIDINECYLEVKKEFNHETN